MEPRFGMGIMPGDFSSHRIVPRNPGTHNLMTGYRRPWALAREAVSELAKDQKNLHFGKDGFQVSKLARQNRHVMCFSGHLPKML